MTKNTSFDFKKAFDELEEINEWFQQEDIDLNVALEKYRRGAELVKKLKGELKETENEFKVIQEALGEEE